MEVPKELVRGNPKAKDKVASARARGKRLVVLMGTEKAVALAVKNGAAGRRYTTLVKRLREAFGIAGGGGEDKAWIGHVPETI